jgi:hypothetical protein
MSIKFLKYIRLKKEGDCVLDQNFLSYIDFQYINRRDDSRYKLGSFMFRSLFLMRNTGFKYYCTVKDVLTFSSFREKLLAADKHKLSNDALLFCELIEEVNDNYENEENFPHGFYEKEMSRLDVLFGAMGENKQLNSVTEILLLISEDAKIIWKEYRLKKMYG